MCGTNWCLFGAYCLLMMGAIRKEAVNRAAAFLAVGDDPHLYHGFAVYTASCIEWDDSEMTDDLLDQVAMLYALSDEIEKTG